MVAGVGNMPGKSMSGRRWMGHRGGGAHRWRGCPPERQCRAGRLKRRWQPWCQCCERFGVGVWCGVGKSNAGAWHGGPPPNWRQSRERAHPHPHTRTPNPYRLLHTASPRATLLRGERLRRRSGWRRRALPPPQLPRAEPAELHGLALRWLGGAALPLWPFVPGREPWGPSAAPARLPSLPRLCCKPAASEVGAAGPPATTPTTRVQLLAPELLLLLLLALWAAAALCIRGAALLPSSTAAGSSPSTACSCRHCCSAARGGATAGGCGTGAPPPISLGPAPLPGRGEPSMARRSHSAVMNCGTSELTELSGLTPLMQMLLLLSSDALHRARWAAAGGEPGGGGGGVSSAAAPAAVASAADLLLLMGAFAAPIRPPRARLL